ncbi:hypothetical protein [uncultured Paracoccus sp.]|uniref:hypothetical protein n=1 Tax=uncultured Paracoccus sp. TaxID=189685 RepID=UPI0026184BD1|nr:hypothetical protein [uncultured Paracoccus sp.]
MIELLISACALSAQMAEPPIECRDFSLLFDAREVSVMTCMMHSQPQIAQWQETHPKWQVERWQCRSRFIRESMI